MILFDSTPLDSVHHSARGIGRYVKSLQRALSIQLQPNEFVELSKTPRDAARTLPNLFQHSNREWLRILGSQIALNRSLANFNGVYQSNDLASLAGYHRRTRTIATLYDVIPLIYPELYIANARPMNRMIWTHFAPHRYRQADIVVAISAEVKKTGCEFLGLDPSRVVVIHPGVDQLVPSSSAPSSRPIAPPYFLYAGGIDPRKNIKGLFEAFAIAASMLPEHRLVLAGKLSEGQAIDLQGMAESNGIGNKVDFLGFIPDSSLIEHYCHAEAFVFPTLSEGFGFPVLEAMGLGCPVLASSLSCIPEIAGNAALLRDPRNIEDFADGLVTITSDSQLRNELSRRGREQAKLYKWEASAAQHVELYRKLL